jgi:hypothetical protein
MSKYLPLWSVDLINGEGKKNETFIRVGIETEQ